MDIEMQVALTRIEGKIDSMHGQIMDARADQADHETRIRAIERKLWGYSGAIGLVAAVSSSSALYLLTAK